MKQIELNIYKGTHGGRRPGAGRPRTIKRGCNHKKRENVNKRTPVHINFKYNSSIRTKAALSCLKRAILNARRKGFRILHYSLQSNHVHLIAEAPDNMVLERGMRSLTVTMVKGLKASQVGRYHLHVLKIVREAKNAIRYVLFNEQKHGGASIDEFSSIFGLIQFSQLIRAHAKNQKISITMKGRFHSIPISMALSFLAKDGFKQLF